MTKPHIDITKRLPEEVMRVINTCLGLAEDSQEVKFLMAYAIKGDELTKFLLAPEYAKRERVCENDREEQMVLIQDIDSECVLKVRTQSGRALLCKENSGGGERCCCWGT